MKYLLIFQQLPNLAPHEVKQRTVNILDRNRHKLLWVWIMLLLPWWWQGDVHRKPLQRRQLDGALNWVPPGFYAKGKGRCLDYLPNLFHGNGHFFKGCLLSLVKFSDMPLCEGTVNLDGLKGEVLYYLLWRVQGYLRFNNLLWVSCSGRFRRGAVAPSRAIKDCKDCTLKHCVLSVILLQNKNLGVVSTTPPALGINYRKWGKVSH